MAGIGGDPVPGRGLGVVDADAVATLVPGAEIPVLIKLGNRINPLGHPGTRQQP